MTKKYKVKMWNINVRKLFSISHSHTREIFPFYKYSNNISNIILCVYSQRNSIVFKPVSYTHLDVYKRQLIKIPWHTECRIRAAFLRQRNLMISGIEVKDGEVPGPTKPIERRM